MDCLEIEGGRKLCGQVRIQGSKNAVLPILSAALLNPGTTVLHDCPKIADVTAMGELLKGFGCQVKWEGNSLWIRAGIVKAGTGAAPGAENMRASVLLLGSLLARTGEAYLPYPGGCVIGKRPVDLHLLALRQLGAEIQEEEQGLRARCERPRGARIRLFYPSVGATENVLLLAVAAEGETVLENAAREPEIRELCRFLRAQGAEISGEGSPRIVIKGKDSGKKQFQDTEFRVMPDRIVAGTYLFLAAAVGGEVVLKNAPMEQLEAVEKVLASMGVSREKSGREGEMRIRSPGRPRGGLFVRTEPYPGFPTDLQSPLLAALSRAEGESLVEETVFEARFGAVRELQKMGARIEACGSRVRIRGGSLRGTELEASELRGGAALCIAAAAAEGKSWIRGKHYIDRGYENIIRDLQALGVVIH